MTIMINITASDDSFNNQLFLQTIYHGDYDNHDDSDKNYDHDVNDSLVLVKP